MRRSRDSPISTPSSTGSAPPLSPEPAPRATNGTPSSCSAHDRDDLVARARQHDGDRGLRWYWSRPSDSYVRSWSGWV